MDGMTWARAQWDRLAGWSLIGVGMVLVLLGARGAVGSAFLADQLAYLISGGVVGLACLTLGVGLLLSAGLHDEWRQLERIEATLREPTGDRLNPLQDGDPDRRSGPAADGGPVPARREVTV
ncbi:MAG TPA: hypothetical protein VHL53_00705 [Acidimicrobiia bacterium]|nr:hypothetical protein [Acidimicrobiia bacterium]